MNYDDMQIGMTVKIIDYEAEYSERPEHWSPEMDEWQGAIVTIRSLELSERVFIEEDEQEWQWYPWDFERYETLEGSNPNIMYREHRRNVFIDELRAGWAKQNEKNKKENLWGTKSFLDKSN